MWGVPAKYLSHRWPQVGDLVVHPSYDYYPFLVIGMHSGYAECLGGDSQFPVKSLYYHLLKVVDLDELEKDENHAAVD